MNLEEFNNNIAKLKLASECYYKTENTIMTDNEYDILINKCREYDKEHKLNTPFLNVDVGFEINGKPVIKHIKRMYSQKDIFNIEDALTWVNKKKTKVFYLEPKLDGCSCNLLYINGKLKSIATRGDGFIGQDITHLKDVILNIPLTIDYTEQIEIRGELVISYKNFKNYKEDFKNPRNMVAGSLSLLDTEEFKRRNIEFIPWGLGFTKKKLNKSELKPFLTKMKFKAMPFTNIISDASEINTYYKKIIKASKVNSLTSENKTIELDYPIDGLMIYINKHEEQSFYGYASRFPLYSMAFKLPATEVSTTLLDVDFDIGRNGNLTIVGILEPVELLGSTVSRASLHNLNYIYKKDIRIKDKVIVYKAGDIIPAIKESFTNIRTGEEKIITIKKCPYCKTKLVDDTILRCSNINCVGILKSKLKYAVSKKCLNLDGIGNEFINKAVDKLKIHDIYDFFNMSIDDIWKIIGSKNKSNLARVENTFKTINIYKNKPFSLKLESLSINGLGKATCNNIESKGILTIEEYLKYLNNNQNAVNKRILESFDDKIIKYLG